jgi:large subunit ribosomal protein L24
MPKLHVKKGDLVQVIAGKNKGAKGRIIAAYPAKGRVVVEGVNMIKKHSKVTQHQGHTHEGGVRTMEAPIHVSNVKKLKDEEKPEKKAAATGDADATGEDS